MGYLIFDVAGKHWSTTDKGAAANYVSITEIAANVALSIVGSADIGGNVTVSGYWADLDRWGRDNLLDGNTSYTSNGEGYYSTALIFYSNNALDTSSFVRFVLQASAMPLKLDIWVGSPEWRIPKEITVYFCDSYTASTHLTGRNNDGLTLLGKIIVPNDLNVVTKYTINVRDPITVSGEIAQPILNIGVSQTVPVLGVDADDRPIGSMYSPDKQSVTLDKLIAADSPSVIRKCEGIEYFLPTSRLKRVFLGLYADNLHSVTKIVVKKSGAAIYNLATTKVVPIRNGQYITVFAPDSNQKAKFKLTVTPTHQYKSQTVNIHSEYPFPVEVLGKYQLRIGDRIVIPYGSEDSDIRIIDAILTPDKFETGVNLCNLDFLYPSGIIEHVPFNVIKEEPKRTIVERTFKNYDGGYIGDKLLPLPNAYACGEAFLVPDGLSSTLIQTSLNTDIPLVKYTGLQGVQMDAVGVRVLVSFDKGITWKALVDNSWQTVSIDNISTLGMREDVINSIVFARWLEIFKPTSLDFAIYLDDTLSYMASKSQEVKLESIGVIATKYNRSASCTYNAPLGYCITRVDINMSGYSYPDTDYFSGGGFATYRNGVQLSSESHFYVYSASYNYGENNSNRPDSVSTYAYAGMYANTNGVSTADIYGAPSIAYLKSITAQITPRLKMGYAFIM